MENLFQSSKENKIPSKYNLNKFVNVDYESTFGNSQPILHPIRIPKKIEMKKTLKPPRIFHLGEPLSKQTEDTGLHIDKNSDLLSTKFFTKTLDQSESERNYIPFSQRFNASRSSKQKPKTSKNKFSQL